MGGRRYATGELLTRAVRAAVQPLCKALELPLHQRAGGCLAHSAQVLAQLVADLLELRIVVQLLADQIRDALGAQMHPLSGDQRAHGACKLHLLCASEDVPGPYGEAQYQSVHRVVLSTVSDVWPCRSQPGRAASAVTSLIP